MSEKNVDLERYRNDYPVVEEENGNTTTEATTTTTTDATTITTTEATTTTTTGTQNRPSQGPDTTDTTSKTPATGDNSLITFYISLMFAAIITAVITEKRRRKA